MEAIELNVEERGQKGGSVGDRLRKAGQVPGVVYGYGLQNQIVVVQERDFVKQVSGASAAQLFRFKSGSSPLDGRLALVKDVQMDALKGRPLHIDFFAINENERLTVEVSIEFVGESPSVKGGDGLLNVSAHEIEVECLPHSIPQQIQVDISGLTLGNSIHAGDVVLPEGITLKSDPELTIVGVVQKREEAEAPAAAAEAAPAADAKAAAEKSDKK